MPGAVTNVSVPFLSDRGRKAHKRSQGRKFGGHKNTRALRPEEWLLVFCVLVIYCRCLVRACTSLALTTYNAKWLFVVRISALSEIRQLAVDCRVVLSENNVKEQNEMLSRRYLKTTNSSSKIDSCHYTSHILFNGNEIEIIRSTPHGAVVVLSLREVFFVVVDCCFLELLGVRLRTAEAVGGIDYRAYRESRNSKSRFHIRKSGDFPNEKAR